MSKKQNYPRMLRPVVADLVLAELLTYCGPGNTISGHSKGMSGHSKCLNRNSNAWELHNSKKDRGSRKVQLKSLSTSYDLALVF
jgi:hypothetical protein